MSNSQSSRTRPKLHFLLLVLVASHFSVGNGPARSQCNDHLIIAVLDFRNTSPDSTLNHFRINIPELLTTFLAQNQKLHLVERLALDKVARELYIHETDRFESRLKDESHRLVGADVVLVGSFFMITGSKAIHINARFVCVETGTIGPTAYAHMEPIGRVPDKLRTMAMRFEKRLLDCKKCFDRNN